MKRNFINRRILISLIIGLVFTSSCEKDKIYPTDRETTSEFYDLMNQWYYWKDSIPVVDLDNYSSPEALLEGMRFLPKDKWSYITTEESFSQYYDEGTYVGYGFGYASDGDGNARITFLFDDSDLNDYGIARGWIIREINGTVIIDPTSVSGLLGVDEVGNTNTIKLESPTGEIVTQDFTKKIVSMNTVLSEMIIDVGTKKVGYFMFKSFIGPSEAELDNVLTYFKTEQIDELVIDLRYNGGGQMDIVSHLASLIIPDDADGEVFVTYEHNNDRSDQNQTTNFDQNPLSLRLNKIYFIAGHASASASEAIINCLDPYMDVYVVGDDTYGKPVGMYAFGSTISDLVYVPISFKLVNADGFGGYYGGLAADSYVEDDVLHNFGKGEAVLDEVLYHIENGTFSSLKSSTEIYRSPKVEIRNFKDEIGAI
ncbi:MAG: hypothetical protein C0597_01935 [Marinilabiliales bacterium]|nr:MAG: hypothetical protein C0597_01935 [Marinilabiliales bacterium]